MKFFDSETATRTIILILLIQLITLSILLIVSKKTLNHL